MRGRFSQIAVAVSLLLILVIAGCGTGGTERQTLVRLDLDRKEPLPFIEFYFTPYAPSGESLYESGLILEDQGTFFLDLDVLEAVYSAASDLRPLASDGTLAWDELKPFLNEHYYEVVDAPASLAEFMSGSELPEDRPGIPEVEDDAGWMELEINGVMTSATRRVLIPEAAIRHALEQYFENDRQLLYPVGTKIVADHLLDSDVAETTAMRKRSNRYWDFFVFDAEGELTDSTSTPPKSLRVPTQCAGCHLGSRLYEPEKSFPGNARPGPDGPRALHVSDRLKNSAVVRLLDEHRMRSDGILGLYGTIYLSNLLASRSDAEISAEDAALLDTFGL